MNKYLIPLQVRDALSDPQYQRVDEDELVAEALNRLGVRSELFHSFYQAYSGPFWSIRVGAELLDVIEGPNTVEVDTGICRKKFGLPANFFVLTKYAAGQVVVLDDLSEKIYEMDFEGGVELLSSGTLPVRWTSLASFLIEYFADE